ncbi:MAG TPA: antibiotic biosynthesis monooxygenase [Ktedonobacterales bacterium]|nr:antibiotic biosynthesis monooxygenase [Ktedonobacterales bacterium]
MIARTWHGITPIERSDEYLRLMLTVAVPDYQAVPGNRGVYVMRRVEEEHAHFLLLTLWESEDAIRAFAGPDIERAKYYPFDSDFLLELEPTVAHYAVCAAPTLDAAPA